MYEGVTQTWSVAVQDDDRVATVNTEMGSVLVFIGTSAQGESWYGTSRSRLRYLVLRVSRGTGQADGLSPPLNPGNPSYVYIDE